MKQFITLALLLLFVPAVAAAQFSLTVTEENNRVWNLSVHYTPEESGQTALQFDLLLPNGLALESTPETTVPDGYTVRWAEQTGGEVRVVIYSGSGTAFGTAGHIVFCCKLTATGNLPADDYTIRLTGGRASTLSGAEYVLNEATCIVSVSPPVPASYLVTWLIDGQPFAEQTIEEGSALIPLDVPEREGYTFSGWQNLPDIMPSEDLRVSGQWTVNIYRLLYYLDGKLYDSQEIPFGTAIQPLPAPVPEEQFSGWSGLPETMPAHDVTVTGTTILSAVTTPVPDTRRKPVHTLDGRFMGYYSVKLLHSLPTGVYTVSGRKLMIATH